MLNIFIPERLMARFIIAQVGLLVMFGTSQAAELLDPQADRAYEWRIVLHCPPHPLLGPGFRDRLTREIRTALQPAVGESARVVVIDLLDIPRPEWEPSWSAFVEQGWPSLEPNSPKAPRPLNGLKTHFVRVSVRGRTFRIEARQHDGDTGLLSPVQRVRETTAPESVGRLAGLIIGPDFGAVGTITEIDRTGEWARLRLRASDLADPRGQVERGDVFAVVTILKSRSATRPSSTPNEPIAPEPLTALPREFTLLRATEPPTPSGTIRCDVLTQYVTPFPKVPGVAGFRCLKLATVSGPVKIQVTGNDGVPAPAGLPVRVRAVDSDFGVRPNPRDFLVLNNGVFSSNRTFRNVACVSVSLGGTRGERRFPLPILGTGTPIVVPYAVNEDEVAKAAFERQCEELRGRIAEARTAERALYEGLFKLITDGKNQDALTRATTGLANLKKADEQFTALLGRLKSEPGAKEPLPAALLTSSETMLLAMRDSFPQLNGRIDDLKTSIEKAKDPVRFEKEFRAKEMVAQIKQYLEFGDVPEALAMYDSLYALTKQDDVKAQRDKLESDAKSKGPEHTAAREYVGTQWRAASTVEDYQAGLTKLRDASDTLIKYEDRYGLRFLLASLEPPIARLKQMTEVLDPNSDVDRPKLRDIQGVVNGLLEVEASAREKLKEIEAKP